MNRIGRRTIMCMLLIAALAIIWNAWGGASTVLITPRVSQFNAWWLSGSGIHAAPFLANSPWHSSPVARGGVVVVGSRPAMGRDIRNYLITFFVTLGVVALVLAGAVASVGARLGATVSLASLASIQSDEPDKIVLPFDLRYGADYKLAVLRKQRPDIIYISSSRAGQARSQMFQPYSFYSLSFTAWTLDQLTDVFERATRDFRPRVVIIELDYFMFTDAWVKDNAERSMIFDRPFRYIRSSAIDLVRAALQEPTRLFKDVRPAKGGRDFVGTQAILKQEGFRYDGSYLFSPGHIAHSNKTDLTADFLIQAMPGAPSISQKQMAALKRLSDIARERGISLVGIQLPYIKEAVEYLDTNEGYHFYSGVWREFESAETQDKFAEMGIKFFDLAHTTIGGDKSNFIDAYHPAEIGMLKAVQILFHLSEFRSLFPAIEPGQIDKQIMKADMSRL